MYATFKAKSGEDIIVKGNTLEQLSCELKKCCDYTLKENVTFLSESVSNNVFENLIKNMSQAYDNFEVIETYNCSYNCTSGWTIKAPLAKKSINCDKTASLFLTIVIDELYDDEIADKGCILISAHIELETEDSVEDIYHATISLFDEKHNKKIIKNLIDEGLNYFNLV